VRDLGIAAALFETTAPRREGVVVAAVPWRLPSKKFREN
jgi:hypothetical protein